MSGKEFCQPDFLLFQYWRTGGTSQKWITDDDLIIGSTGSSNSLVDAQVRVIGAHSGDVGLENAHLLLP